MIATQHSLVARLRLGGSNADWDRFDRVYKRPLMAYAASRMLSESDCADVYQEFSVRMYRVGFARFEPGKGKFSSFLFQVLEGLVKDAHRRRIRESSRFQENVPTNGEDSPNVLDVVPDQQRNPVEEAERQGQVALVHVTLEFLVERNAFRPKTVGIFKALVFDQRDPSEVAQAFGSSVGNVYEAKRAVLSKLRSMLIQIENGAELEDALINA